MSHTAAFFVATTSMGHCYDVSDLNGRLAVMVKARLKLLVIKRGCKFETEILVERQ